MSKIQFEVSLTQNSFTDLASGQKTRKDLFKMTISKKFSSIVIVVKLRSGPTWHSDLQCLCHGRVGQRARSRKSAPLRDKALASMFKTLRPCLPPWPYFVQGLGRRRRIDVRGATRVREVRRARGARTG